LGVARGIAQRRGVEEDEIGDEPFAHLAAVAEAHAARREPRRAGDRVRETALARAGVGAGERAREGAVAARVRGGGAALLGGAPARRARAARGSAASSVFRQP